MNKLVIALAVLLPTIIAGGNPRLASAASDPAVVQLQMHSDRGDVLATAVLVRREDGPEGAVLYFLTSGAFRAAASLMPTVPGPDELADAASIEIAVLRVRIAATSLMPARLVLDSPEPGEPFFIISHDAAGTRLVTSQRVGQISERLAIGDHEIDDAACLGAPAFSSAGLFGVVTECAPGQPPRVTLLSGVRSFLRRMIPDLDLGPGELRSGVGH